MDRHEFYAKVYQAVLKAKKSGLSEAVLLDEFRYARRRTYK